ncbi:monofunctional biosynthetic peptidoglycan transglycosylase [Methylopila jiangsuensis]|uniref:Biosynthetic peptidoglycan transglycosylase n=1 Tax=Methylopila jiangsuensis TaxID=586230 RepID=A0A9W6N4I7_9HYPH|nr:monofunctional biosynthetic peptidoglycan transglycosylase [Methylopila jiangsuensis]GLK77276.1 monofunctional biosynthetic peptidoglycan transglycosylase [Methylopila jiangsuensis]
MSSSFGGPSSRTGRFGLARLALWVLAAMVAAPLALTLVYAVIPPPSTLMIGRWLTLQPVSRTWVPLDRMSPHLPRAVVVSEDAQFCRHHGVDWGAVRLVLDQGGEGGPSRGASTITMQVAKNLFLWQGAPYLRKPLEIALAHWIELVWSKRRIMEVYLNIAEWGPDGVFGAEAGARRAFRKGAGALSARESAIMAAALPNPVTRDARKPGRRAAAHAGVILRRMRGAAVLTGCLGP